MPLLLVQVQLLLLLLAQRNPLVSIFLSAQIQQDHSAALTLMLLYAPLFHFRHEGLQSQLPHE
jgi:hypothetical protein